MENDEEFFARELRKQSTYQKGGNNFCQRDKNLGRIYILIYVELDRMR